MKPEDFNRTLMDEAYRLRLSARSHTRGSALDPKTTIWVIREDAWREMLRQADYSNGAVQDKMIGGTHRSLMGLPVRLTIDDDDDTPMIQLVMEPLVFSGLQREKIGE